MSGTPLLLRIRAAQAEMQPALARIAELVLADPRTAASMSIGEIAGQASCSEATVVRFARELGCNGYRDLRFQLHEEVVAARVEDAPNAPMGDIDPADDLATMTAKIAASDSRAIHDTVRGLDLEVLDDVATRALGAHRILLYGMGASGLSAADEHHKLTRVGLDAVVYQDLHQALAAFALAGPDDLAIIFSDSGRTVEILDACRILQENGSPVVAVTGSGGSPLARTADFVLVSYSEQSQFRSAATASRIAQLTVVDCLFVAVVSKLPDLGGEALRRTREAVAGRRVD
jgi:DNA-binding MurR/RpiR family transcriptional regulator